MMVVGLCGIKTEVRLCHENASIVPCKPKNFEGHTFHCRAQSWSEFTVVEIYG
jgi:hypothetical protein